MFTLDNTECSTKITVISSNQYEIWLKKHSIRYHGLLMGKPRGGNYHWIDNHIVRATRYEGKFTDMVLQTKKDQYRSELIGLWRLRSLL